MKPLLVMIALVVSGCGYSNDISASKVQTISDQLDGCAYGSGLTHGRLHALFESHIHPTDLAIMHDATSAVNKCIARLVDPIRTYSSGPNVSKVVDVVIERQPHWKGLYEEGWQQEVSLSKELRGKQ